LLEPFQSFDCLHDLKSVSDFTSYLHRIVNKAYGVAGFEYVRMLIDRANDNENKDENGLTCLEYWDKLIEDYKNILLEKHDGAEEQVKRVAGDFAVRAAAGELATKWGITGWEKGEALDAVIVIFDGWIEARGGCSNKEGANMLNQIKSFLEKNEESCFIDIQARLKAEAEKRTYPKTINKVGYIHNIDGVACYLVIPSQFKEQVCKGLDSRATLKTLKQHGWLYLQPGSQKYQAKERIPTFHDHDTTTSDGDDVKDRYEFEPKNAWAFSKYGSNDKPIRTEVRWFYVLVKAKVFGGLNDNE